MKIFNLVVKQIVNETKDSYTIVFETPKEQFNYKSGQFITLILKINGSEVRRSYSLSSSPGIDNYPSVCIKIISKGVVSNYLKSNLKPGDSLQAIEPMGNFFFDPKSSAQQHIVLIGAGSGITPLFSIAKSVLQFEPNSKVSLFYGNRLKEDIIYFNQFEDLAKKYGSRFQVVHSLTKPENNWTGFTGRINESAIIKLIESISPIKFKECQYYICGPNGLAEEATKALDLLGVGKANIHKESYGHDKNEVAAASVVAASTLANGKSRVKIIDGKKIHEFEVDPKHTILETAIKLDINLPYSCQAGMCTACMGKCTTGKVHMENADGLTDNEIKQGYVLTCIGHPASAEIVIEL
ncbi:MAG: ferredoxin--NADP reductase [Cytophagales bacterium]|nr:MAG: ferredoxin--NADP reductase [Cytophagales bacterium]